MRSGHEGLGTPFQMFGVEFQTDHEHVKNHAQLRDDLQIGRNLGRQHEGRRFRPQQRGTKQNAGNHLADHRWLADEDEDASDHLARHDDGGESEKNVRKRIGRVRSRLCGRFARCRRRRNQRLAVISNERGKSRSPPGRLPHNRKQSSGDGSPHTTVKESDSAWSRGSADSRVFRPPLAGCLAPLSPRRKDDFSHYKRRCVRRERTPCG